MRLFSWQKINTEVKTIVWKDISLQKKLGLESTAVTCFKNTAVEVILCSENYSPAIPEVPIVGNGLIMIEACDVAAHAAPFPTFKPA